ncbi:MAG: NTP/NDP exchange transporter Npt1 [Simkaniaceae bacterium]
MMTIFLSFYVLFAFVLYPLQDILHPNGIADRLEAALPHGFHGLIAIFRNWTFTLFYVMSELWGTAIMTVLFWGFANEVTSVEEAKRYYGILGVGANLSTIVAGIMSVMSANILSYEVFKKFPSLFSFNDEWGQCLATIVLIVTVFGLLSMLVFYWMNKKVFFQNYEQASLSPDPKKNIKMGLKKNFSYLAKSKYLICIAIIVIMYNISINMIEIVWKDQMRDLFPDPTHYNAYQGKVQIVTGIISTIIAWFVCGNVIRKLGWTFSALITPITLLLSGVIFFLFILFKETSFLTGIALLLGTTPLALTVFFGSLQNCLSRACKFTLFDATKEVTFIPLSNECKLKGKAAIDGVGSRLGKSGGSIIHQFLLMIFGTVGASSPFVGLLLLFIIGAWIVATKSLGKQFDALTESKEKIDVEAEEPASLVTEPTG